MRFPGAGLCDRRGESRLAGVEQALCLRLDLPDGERVRAVGDEAVEGHADVDGDEVALLEAVLLARDPVDDHPVRRGADRRRESRDSP